ncbi:hypothetical protein SteCoe_33139 [Stentor coeruleus]|uniref:RRM domain-containing protein n=1 Tax=Stentor coeruleus TaxID=5963 RepID=A0A1R2AXE6_9CILI|nr:hypothetical protein SteCoe_33139 [Stentor coeruleus]
MENLSQTLYIRNLNDKVNKNESKKLLYHLFCTYGYILEIQNSKTGKLRGQAFIVFDKVDSAVLAMKDLQGFNFLGKPMRIEYSKAQSHTIEKLQGTFQYKKKPRPQIHIPSSIILPNP